MRNVFLRFATYCIGVIAAVAIGAVLIVYPINRREVGNVKQMMQDASQLRIQTSKADDVLAFSHKYHGEVNSTGNGQPCGESDCLVIVARDSRDLWKGHSTLADVAEHVSRRRWRIYILVWVKGGRLSGIQQEFGYLTPNSDISYLSERVVTTVNRPNATLCRNPFFRLHRMFAAYPDPSPWFFRVWVDPSAVQEREMLRLNLDCVLRLSGCKGVPDMAPAAWKAYEIDQLLIDADKGKGREEIANDSECR